MNASSPEDYRELQQLVDTMLDMGLTEQQNRRLNEFLNDDRAVDYYVRYVDFHGDLHWRRRGGTLTWIDDASKSRATDSPAASQPPRGARSLGGPAWRLTGALATLACMLLLVAGYAVFTSIDSTAPPQPISAEWLSGKTLRLADDSAISWEFSDANVTISIGAGAAPTAIAEEILQDDSSAARTETSEIQASWRLSKTDQLHLFDLRADGKTLPNRNAHLPIKRIAQNRVLLGGRRYRAFPQ